MMQAGNPQIAAWRGGAVQLSQSDIDKMREKRNLGLRKLKTIGLANATIAVITIGIGIGILIVSSRGKTGWPVFNFGPIVCGLIMFIAGVLAIWVGKKGEGIERLPIEETPCSVKGLFIAQYVLCVIGITICLVSGVFCILSAAVCGSESERFVEYCYPDKGANIALAAIGGVTSIILAVLCIISSCFFCIYARSFGFKNRYERAMERQMGMMMRAMAEQQQGQGQPTQGQYGQYYNPPPPYKA